MHHGVRIQDAALVAAAVLSDRYITGRQLPDKAIDLIDEAASRLRIEIDSMPFEIDVVERRIRQLEIERAALAEGDRRRLASSGSTRSKPSCSRCRRSATGWSRTGSPRRTRSARSRTARSGSSRRKLEAERAERDGDLERAAQLRYGHIPVVEREVDAMLSTRLNDLQRDGAMLKEEVDEEDVAEIVAKWTGIPVSRLMEGEMAKLVRLEEHLHERVIGQDEAVSRGRERDPSFACRPLRSAPADRFVPVPRSDRCRQDRARARARRVPVRRRAGDGAHRHVGVHGEALGVAPRRRAARLRRLRGGRSAHRSGAAPSVRGDPARRDREGAPRRVQRAVAADGRRPAHRRSGSHGRLHEHRRDHDVEPRCRWRRGRR